MTRIDQTTILPGESRLVLQLMPYHHITRVLALVLWKPGTLTVYCRRGSLSQLIKLLQRIVRAWTDEGLDSGWRKCSRVVQEPFLPAEASAARVRSRMGPLSTEELAALTSAGRVPEFGRSLRWVSIP